MTAIRMIARPAVRNAELVRRFEANCLMYDGVPFAGLLSPSSTLIPESAVATLTEQVSAVDTWVDGVLDLYADLIRSADARDPMLAMFEWGLDDRARRLQRESTLRHDRPVTARLDCVDLGSDHFITEVQWKGAGEGWLAAIDRSYREVFPLEPGQRALGDLVEAWARHFRNDGCSVNTGRRGWMDAEVFLGRSLAGLGVSLVSCAPEDIQHVVTFAGEDPVVVSGGRTKPLRHLYLDRLTEVTEPAFLDRLVRAYTERRVVLDPPPSYVFNQKLPLAVPFLPGYRKGFDDRVRRALIPTALIGGGAPDLSCLVPSVRHADAPVLGDVAAWEDLGRLPESLRSLLVLKCGSSHQHDNHGGHGVFRLDGPADQARSVLKRVLGRVRHQHEPWVMQPYLGHQWVVPVSLRSEPHTTTEMALHAKFGVYLRLADAAGLAPEVLGGVASLGASWKVSGASKTPARIDEAGRVAGAFRHDIRVGMGR